MSLSPLLSTSSSSLSNLNPLVLAPYLVNPGKGNANLGVKVFFIWGSTCVGCLIFTYFCVPETKGLSLEAIDVLYQNTTPVHSVSYRRRLIAEEASLGLADVQAQELHHPGEKAASYPHSFPAVLNLVNPVELGWRELHPGLANPN